MYSQGSGDTICAVCIPPKHLVANEFSETRPYLTWFCTFVFAGDEIVAVNGTCLQGSSHEEAIRLFRAVKNGKLIIHFLRREGSEKLR